MVQAVVICLIAGYDENIADFDEATDVHKDKN